MKIALSIATLALLFTSCQKDLSTSEAVSSETVASDALAPLPCHTLTFKVDKVDAAIEVPSFRFTKTLYPDTRVKTINMMSRKFPIHQFYSNYAIELTGQFSYGPNRAYLKGTSTEWLHYRYTDGTTRKVVSKKNVNLKFYINERGLCTRVTDLDLSVGRPESLEHTLLNVAYGTIVANGQYVLDYIAVRRNDRKNNADGWVYYNPRRDQYGNTLDYYFPFNEGGYNSYPTYQYDYTKPRGNKNYSFIPSQNLISQEYSLLEVMQWVPQPTHQRKGVGGVFYLDNSTQKVVQSQVYKNYKFDAKGNQISVTYGDNVPQLTTWYCK